MITRNFPARNARQGVSPDRPGNKSLFAPFSSEKEESFSFWNKG
jgi:hypothetical protein